MGDEANFAEREGPMFLSFFHLFFFYVSQTDVEGPVSGIYVDLLAEVAFVYLVSVNHLKISVFCDVGMSLHLILQSATFLQ